jgi:hypothetical protein
MAFVEGSEWVEHRCIPYTVSLMLSVVQSGVKLNTEVMCNSHQSELLVSAKSIAVL